MLRRLKRTIKVLFFPLAVLFIATSFTGAYFSDSVSVTNNKFETGSWGGGTSSSGKVIISEVFYDPNGTDTGFEWIELYNSGDDPVDLTGYSLMASRSSTSDKSYVIPVFILNQKSLVLIHINKTGTDTTADLYEGYSNADDNLRNGLGSIVLYKSALHSQATIVDFIRHGSSSSLPLFGGEIDAIAAGIWNPGDTITNADSGDSLEINNKNNDTNNSGGWHDQSPPTPGF